MNKFSKDLTAYLTNLFNVCTMCEIDDIAIEQSMVRGYTADAKKGIFIMEYDNIPELDFSGLGIRGVKTLKSRMNILDEDNLSITYDTKQKDNGDIVIKKMTLASKKTKVDFTCADPALIKAPKKLNDPDLYSFTLTEDTVKVMSKIKNAVAGVDEISFNSEKDGTIKFIVIDENGDIFDHTIAESYECLDPLNTAKHFFHSYKIKYVHALFKAAMDLEGEAKLILSSRGVIKIVVKDITIRIVAE
jgi:hypothetical protein